MMLIIDGNGTVLAQYPNQRDLIGQDFNGHPLVRAMLSQPEGLVTEKHVDLEQTARELGVLTDGEEIRTTSALATTTTMVAENG